MLHAQIDETGAILAAYEEFLDPAFLETARTDVLPGFLVDPESGFGIHAEILAAVGKLREDRDPRARAALEAALERLAPLFDALTTLERTVTPDGTLMIDA